MVKVNSSMHSFYRCMQIYSQLYTWHMLEQKYSACNIYCTYDKFIRSSFKPALRWGDIFPSPNLMKGTNARWLWQHVHRSGFAFWIFCSPYQMHACLLQWYTGFWYGRRFRWKVLSRMQLMLGVYMFSCYVHREAYLGINVCVKIHIAVPKAIGMSSALNTSDPLGSISWKVPNIVSKSRLDVDRWL